MAINLIYANKDKSKGDGGWTLDYKYLMSIQKIMEAHYSDSVSLEDIEAILLVANGESVLLA